jgi:lipopolysaccharide export system protein LptA
MRIFGRKRGVRPRWLGALVIGWLLAASAARAAGEAPAAPAETNGTVITSRSMTFDYPARKARFEGDVVVTDPQVRMQADQMTVDLNERSEIETVTATGNVRIDQAERTAFCRQAVYTVPSGLMVLTGAPRIVRGQDVLSGTLIRFKRDENKVECKDARLQIAPGSTSMKDMLKP